MCVYDELFLRPAVLENKLSLNHMPVLKFGVLHVGHTPVRLNLPNFGKFCLKLPLLCDTPTLCTFLCCNIWLPCTDRINTAVARTAVLKIRHLCVGLILRLEARKTWK